MARAVLLSGLLLACIGLVGGIAFVACQSSAETPNAYFGRDGGPGDLGQLCRNASQCNDTTLVCVDEDGDVGALPPFCREACVTTDADPCGLGSTCVAIRNTDNAGACLPAPAVGEACSGRCDDGLSCIETAPDAGGACHTDCTLDGGPACPDGGSCSGSNFCQ